MPAHDLVDLTGRVAWITGAGRGIGLACATLLNECGASVVGLDLEPTAELARVATSRALDVTNVEIVNTTATELNAAGLAPDILVNNAGITRDGVVWKLSDADWATVLRVNLDGAFHMTRAAVPLMRSRGGGCIVNVASINGERGKFGQSNYCAAKAGLIGLTKATARELGKFNIRVNALAPGMIATSMTQGLAAEARQRAIDESLLGRVGEPDDVAKAALFLCSSLASHITGQVLRVDGGQYL
jgi:NAD(P)-dependent dehydrogenase (short-subunit alcohol dehydrogenase family)